MYKTAQYSPELSALCSTGVRGPRDSPTTHTDIAGVLALSAAYLAGIQGSASPRPSGPVGSGPRGGRALQGVSLTGKWQGELWPCNLRLAEVSRVPEEAAI